MGITAAQLVAKVAIEGGEETKRALLDIAKTTNQASEKAKGTQSVFGDFLKSQVIFNAVSTAAGFLKDQFVSIFQESMQNQQAMAQTVAVLKSTHDASGETAQSIADLATKYSHLTLFSDDTTQAAENMLLTFTNIGKSVFPQATKTVLDMSQALGQDTKSSAIQLGKALNDPVQGITALQRVGVTFTDSQKNLIKSLVDSGNVAGAQKVILAELQREFGGSAEAAGKTFPGQLQILGQSMDDIKQNIGDALMPILKNLTTWVSGQIVPAFGHVSDWISSVGVPALQHLGDFITGTVVPGFQNFVRWIGTFTGAGDGMKILLIALATILAVAVVPTVWSLAAGVIAATWPVLAIGAAVAILVALFEHWYNTNAGFKAFIDGLVAGLKQAWTVVQENFLPAMKQIGDWIKTYVWPVLQQIGAFIASQFVPVWQQLTQLWNSQLLPLFKQLWQGIQQLTPLFQLLGVILGGLVATAIGIIIGLITGLAKGIAYMVEGLANVVAGIVRAFTGIVQFVSGIVQFINDLIHGNFSKLGADLGQIWQGILNMWFGLWQAVGGVFQAAWGLISGLVGGFVQGIVGFFQNLFDMLVGHSIIPDMWNAIVGWFTSMPDRIIGLIVHFAVVLIERFNMLKAEAVAIFESIVSGIGNAFSKLGGMAQSAWNGVWGAIKGGINNVIGMINGLIDRVDSIHVNVPGIGNIGFSIPHIPYLALGGQITQSGLAVVGERGPELAYLPAGAQVIPNSQAFGGFGQGAPSDQPIILVMDGYAVARGLMPHVMGQLRDRLGVRF